MAVQSVSSETLDIESYGAKPVLGNYTSEASMHLWCAESLAHTLTGAGLENFDQWNDNIRDGVLYLLSQEIRRARQALRAESDERATKRTVTET